MKRILLTALVFLLLFNSAGYVFTYWQLKIIFKKTALKKIEQSLTNEQLQLIITSLDGKPIDTSNCIRENKKEFRLNNEMYDIVRSEVKGDKIYNYCLKDDNENRLEAAFVNYVEGNSASPAGTVPLKNLLKNLSGDWEALHSYDFFFTIAEEISAEFQGSILSEYYRIPEPPPEMLSC